MSETTKNEVIPFGYGDYLVRSVKIDGEIWFVAKDVCNVLEYGNYRDAIARHVDEDDKGVVNTDTPGGKQEMIIINESGLYSLILRSNKPEAKQFKKWVTSEVLPALRKRGYYSTREKDVKYIERLEQRVRTLEEMITAYLRYESEPILAGDYIFTTEDLIALVVEKVTLFNSMTKMSTEYLVNLVCRKLKIKKLEDIRPYHYDLLNQILDEMERYCIEREVNTEKILKVATEFKTIREIAEESGLSSYVVGIICRFLARKGYMEEERTPNPEKKKSVILRYKTIKKLVE